MSIEWKGEELKAKLSRAIPWGINKTMELCVREAKTSHPWINRTAIAEGSIQMQLAQPTGDGFAGLWGSFGCKYFLGLELGNPPHKIPNAFGKGITVDHPGNKPFPTLRPAAANNYSKLKDFIREAMNT